MITGAHAILYSADAEADRAFLQRLLNGYSVDAGEGWLILRLPPAEVAVHPTDGPATHELYLMCDDIQTTIHELREADIAVEGGISDQGWGLLTTLVLPSGSRLGLYEPRHPVAAAVG